MSKRFKILISAPYMQPVIERFMPLFEEHGLEIIAPPVSERLDEEDLLQVIGDVDGIICGDDKLTERVLLAAPRLKILSKWGTGIDSIDQEACKRLGIAIRNTPNAFSEPVGDSVIGYMLCFARRIPWMSRQMHAGVWDKIPGFTLGEATLGVVGVGNTGKAVIRRAAAFGMRILGCDIRQVDQALLARTGMEMTSLDDLLRRSDFVSLNCDLNPTSHHLMNRERFGLMKPSAYLINASRGPVVEEPALVEALVGKRIAGAALDVFEVEPLPKDSPLLGMDNVLLAPHNANSSPQAWERIHHSTIKNLLDVLDGAR